MAFEFQVIIYQIITSCDCQSCPLRIWNHRYSCYLKTWIHHYSCYQKTWIHHYSYYCQMTWSHYYSCCLKTWIHRCNCYRMTWMGCYNCFCFLKNRSSMNLAWYMKNGLNLTLNYSSYLNFRCCNFQTLNYCCYNPACM